MEEIFLEDFFQIFRKNFFFSKMKKKIRKKISPKLIRSGTKSQRDTWNVANQPLHRLQACILVESCKFFADLSLFHVAVKYLQR